MERTGEVSMLRLGVDSLVLRCVSQILHVSGCFQSYTTTVMGLKLDLPFERPSSDSRVMWVSYSALHLSNVPSYEIMMVIGRRPTREKCSLVPPVMCLLRFRSQSQGLCVPRQHVWRNSYDRNVLHLRGHAQKN